MCFADGIRFPRQHSVRDRDPSGGLAGPGHGRYFGPVREGILVAGQEEEIRDQSAQENAEPRVQRNVPIQGKRALQTSVGVKPPAAIRFESADRGFRFFSYNLVGKRRFRTVQFCTNM